MAQTRTFKCGECQHMWNLPFGTGRPVRCPQCKSRNIHREAAAFPASAGRGRCFRGGR